VVRFEVTDSGIGMAPDVTGRLFQPLHPGDSSTTCRFGGTDSVWRSAGSWSN
jgi:signal transduction histidine kinase